MYENDHTDAELLRRELSAEFTLNEADEYDSFMRDTEGLLIDVGATTIEKGLDGNQVLDGFSIDFAVDLFNRGYTPEECAAEIFWERGLLGFRDGDAT